MNALTKAALLARFVKWRLTWNRRDTRRAIRVPGNPKFTSAREAAARIPDGAVVMVSGLGGNARASVLYWAVRELFEETGHPRGLTVMSVGGFGGRGKAPGTVEEFGVEGLCTRFFSGHLETFKSMLRLADAGRLELQCVPQGVMCRLLAAQGRGEESLVTRIGTGTFMDPRTGRGTPVAGPRAEQFVKVEGDALRYAMPKVTAALFNLPAADEDGNLYAKGAAMIAECREAARAARRNGGLVVAAVGKLVPKGYAEVFLRADDVDAIVAYPKTEQTGGVTHRRPWRMMTTGSDVPIDEAIARLRFVNRVLGITPRRGPADDALARLAASVFAANARRGAWVNIGVGLPEEVCRLVHEGGLTRDLTLFTETGVIGGLPAPGIFFGAAVCPERMISSAEIFEKVNEELDATILGALEVDGDGNVNVSRRGEGAINQVGPGGFIDLTTGAAAAFFVGSWRSGGKPKFVERVSEVTFSGPEALRAGKKVFYCTNVGAFRLTPRGMELIRVMPGLDVHRDVLEACPMRIVLPESGEVPVADDSVATGRGFRLAFGG